MSRLKELREKRGKLIHDARAILDKAEGEKRGLSTEEDKNWGDLVKQSDDLKKDIDREERQMELDREAASKVADASEARAGSSIKEQAAAPFGSHRSTDEYRSAFNHFLANGMNALSQDEVRALSAGTDTQGGFLVAPEQFVTQLVKFMDDLVFIRGLATKFTLGQAASLGAPSLDTDIADSDWTTELGTGSEDSSMAFGKRQLTPHPLAKRIKISNKLIQVGTMPVESLVLQRLGYKFGITQEKAFLTGTGQGQPLGLFTASNDGIGTARDVSTGNAATYPTFDGLIEAKYSLKAQYMSKASWLFHRDALKLLLKLKNGEGEYLWREAVKDGEPDTLLGNPLMMSEYVPNTFTTGKYVGMFADFSHYWIVDVMSMQVQRLMELYAETNQTGFIGRQETDGMPVLAEAFARVKLG